MSRLLLAFTLTALVTLPANGACPDDEDGEGSVLDNRLQAAGPLLLPRPNGPPLKLTFDGARYQVFCFVGCECPLARLYGPRLSALADEYTEKGFDFIGVDSNQQDSLQEVGDYQEQLDIGFPVVKDYDNRLADILSAKRTPEIIIVSPKQKIVYRGRVDNQYSPGVTRAAATRHELSEVLRQLANGEKVTTPETEVEGCLIGRIRQPNTKATITYSNQVARVLDQHCIECHRADEIGPFSLTDYEEAKGWAEMMVEVVDNGRMPPWHASQNHQPLRNARNMPESDKQVLRDWLDSGMPFGSADELPEPRVFTQGWRLPRKPDMIVNMNKNGFNVPSQGTVEYQYFVVDPGFQEDKWVTAAEIKPGQPSVVHHSIVFIRPPDGVPFKGVGWLSAYVPGQSIPPFSETHARRIPAGSKFVFQQHYTPTGQPENDNTSIGLVFADPDKVTHELFTLMGLDQQFEIPPREPHFEVDVSLPRLPNQGVLLSVAPHMHYRGKSFVMTTVDSSGDSQTVVEVPQYDFNWQHSYLFKNPIDLSKLKGINFTATFDNSDANPFNPDPEITVTWGDQTFEEMAVAFFEVAQPRNLEESDPEPLGPRDRILKKQKSAKKITNVVDDFFDRFDRNRDGRILRSEVTKAMKHFGFREYDSDGDNQITREELIEHFSRCP